MRASADPTSPSPRMDGSLKQSPTRPVPIQFYSLTGSQNTFQDATWPSRETRSKKSGGSIQSFAPQGTMLTSAGEFGKAVALSATHPQQSSGITGATRFANIGSNRKATARPSPSWKRSGQRSTTSLAS